MMDMIMRIATISYTSTTFLEVRKADTSRQSRVEVLILQLTGAETGISFLTSWDKAHLDKS